MTRAACGLCLLLAACAGREREPAAPAARGVSERPAVLGALDPSDVAPPPLDGAPGREGGKAAPRGPEIAFAALGGGVAWVVERAGRFLVVHGDRAGRSYDAVAGLAVSADGRRWAYAARLGRAWRMVVDGTEGEEVEDLGSPVFSPDGAHVAYESRTAEGWRLVVDGRRGRPGPARGLGPAFSGDSTRIAWIEAADDEGFGRLVVSDVGLERTTTVDPGASRPVLDAAGARLAAVARAPDGGRRVVTATFARPDRPRTRPAYDAVRGLAFAADRATIAYVAEQSGIRIVVRGDAAEDAGRRDAGAFLPAGEIVGGPVPLPGGAAVGVLASALGAVRLHPLFLGAQDPGPAWDEADGLAPGHAGLAYAYAARRGASWFLVTGGGVGPAFDRVTAPAFSPDGKLVVYRARRAGRSLVVVADDRGRTVREHPTYEQVFQVSFTADGRSVAYGVRAGRVLAWKVEPL